MKDFIILFVAFFVFILFFGEIIFTNIWVTLVLISTILALIAKGFINQSSKIEELEKKVEQLLQAKQDKDGALKDFEDYMDKKEKNIDE